MIDSYWIGEEDDQHMSIQLSGWKRLDVNRLPRKILTDFHEVIHLRRNGEVHGCNKVDRLAILKAAKGGEVYFYRRKDSVDDCSNIIY